MGLGLSCGAGLAPRWLLIGIVTGGVIGAGRMMQGGPFLQRHHFAFYSVWLCCELVRLWDQPPTGSTLSQANPPRSAIFERHRSCPPTVSTRLRPPGCRWRHLHRARLGQGSPGPGRRKGSHQSPHQGSTQAKNAVLVAHYYVDGDLQDLAQETGGCVSDSLEMARFGEITPPAPWSWRGEIHGESARFSAPKTGADARPGRDLFARPGLRCRRLRSLLRRPPRPKVVVYANTSAAVKARADWMVTSSCALAIVKHPKTRAKKFSGRLTAIWAATSRRKPVPTC